MLAKPMTVAVLLTVFVWFHLTCCRFLHDADALSLVGVLLITLLASMTEAIPRNLPQEPLRQRVRRLGTTAWDIVLAATDPRIGLWEDRD